jgi:Cu2+-exporting ATPase
VLFYKTKNIDLLEAKNFEAVTGKGVMGTVNVKSSLGNKKVNEQVGASIQTS